MKSNTREILLRVSQGAFFLTTTQLAKILGVQPKTLQNWQARNKKQAAIGKACSFPLLPVRYSNRRPLYHIDDVTEYLDDLPRHLYKRKLGRPTKVQQIANRQSCTKSTDKVSSVHHKSV